METTLKIYVRESCSGCSEAHHIAANIATIYPHLAIEIIDITKPNAVVPDNIFATPTYTLNNKIVSLGNPKLEDVDSWLQPSELLE